MGNLISIIVPVYNAEKFLIRCTNSILNQTYNNIELILINDGSKDNSLPLCREIANRDPRVKVIDKENGGAASARNRGLDIATGDYIGFCDADDYIHPNMYSDMLRIMNENNMDTLECTSRVEDSTGKEISRDSDDKKLVMMSPEDSLRAIFLRTGNVHMAIRITRKEILHGIRIPEGKRVEDFFFTILLLLKIRENAIYNFPYYTYSITDGSVTRTATGSIYIDALYFFEESLKVLGNKNKVLIDEELYYKLKMYYLFSISMTKEETQHYKDLIFIFQKDIQKNILKMFRSPHFKVKEKIMLTIGSFSMKYCRWLYILKTT